MIFRDNKELVAKRKVREGGTILEASMIYRGARLVWQAIRSCFGSGVWFKDRPWIGTDMWKK